MPHSLPASSPVSQSSALGLDESWLPLEGRSPPALTDHHVDCVGFEANHEFPLEADALEVHVDPAQHVEPVLSDDLLERVGVWVSSWAIPPCLGAL